MKTVGKGIVISDAEAFEAHHGMPADAEFQRHFPDDRLPDRAILVALLSAGLFVTLATFSSIPVSTSQAIVGGVAGALAAQLAAGFGVHLFSMAGIPVSTSQAVVGGVIGVGLTKGARAVSVRKISTSFVGWVVTPLCAAVFAALVYRSLAP
jgi:phosphate/sulfate permease